MTEKNRETEASVEYVRIRQKDFDDMVDRTVTQAETISNMATSIVMLGEPEQIKKGGLSNLWLNISYFRNESKSLREFLDEANKKIADLESDLEKNQYHNLFIEDDVAKMDIGELRMRLVISAENDKSRIEHCKDVEKESLAKDEHLDSLRSNATHQRKRAEDLQILVDKANKKIAELESERKEGIQYSTLFEVEKIENDSLKTLLSGIRCDLQRNGL